MAEQTPSAANQSGLSENAAGGLAYMVIPAVIFLLMEPYTRNSSIRFHSWQCIFLVAALIVIDVALAIVAKIFGLLGLFWPFGIAPMFTLAMLILWIMVLIKAFNGEKLKLPIVGDLAEKRANG